jgi:predicted RNA-binding Zn ribbon-like protein
MIEVEVYGDTLNLRERRLCLDFANTVDWHASDRPAEELNSYADLVSWAQEVGLLTENEALPLYREAAARPADAAAVLERAIELREAIYRIFSAIAGSRPVETADLSILNTWLTTGQGRLQVARTKSGFTWKWGEAGASLGQMLWSVAQSAAELLVSNELDRLKQCADDRGCGWLFLDTSRNRSRRWCDMRSCGNRAKVRRYRRQHAA